MQRKFEFMKYIEILFFIMLDAAFLYVNYMIDKANIDLYTNKIWTMAYYLLCAFAVVCAIFLILDITYLIQLQKESRELSLAAYSDMLTTLPNRNSTSRLMNQYDSEEKIAGVACAMFDLNNLKKTNDSFGHKAGDELIRSFASILAECSKPYGYVARHGGDEFLSIFEHCDETKMQRYLREIEEKVNLYNQTVKVPINYAAGYAIQTETHAQKLSVLVAQADYDMYSCKMQQKNDEKQELTEKI